MKKITTILFALLISSALTSKSFAHCEVPCGIYNDELRVALLYEHFTTIEKAMKQISELSANPGENANQMVRWINTKEDHANKIQDIVTQYFITQRIKLPEEGNKAGVKKYNKSLTLLHQLIVYAMKTKQTTDVKYIDKLRLSLAGFEEIYFENGHRHKLEQDHKH